MRGIFTIRIVPSRSIPPRASLHAIQIRFLNRTLRRYPRVRKGSGVTDARILERDRTVRGTDPPRQPESSALHRLPSGELRQRPSVFSVRDHAR